MAEMLQQAKKEKCFERKRTKFIACDYLTEWLYNKNVKREGEPFTEFFEIPFVMEWLKDHPRPPIPLSLLISEEEAALLIQAFWRAYRVRCDPEIQELRVWQKQLRDEKRGMKKKLLEFWAKQQAKELVVKITVDMVDQWDAKWKTWKRIQRPIALELPFEFCHQRRRIH
ncbi:IQ domain-containing protein K isoform X2 [Latimeria chalumnae]|uniref:IQ domain-containing protein K isoform X2 n=1 Tax=Latimeria chalumnae TaxID=7897 RepID=UPI00313DB494